VISLEVSNLSKSYKKYNSEFVRIASWFGMKAGDVKDSWVLKDISFRLLPGESVGIVGQNGAGKSTLLKIITGTIRQTEGSVARYGRVSAILELGMGFNGDFTGRENARNSLGMMGFTGEEIERVMDFIIDFSELGEYFDQPVRIYSSGMHMRLAFSVATAYRPEILIVDEALSVGDAYFQHKSFSRIKEFKELGTSLLLVSHDKEAVQSVCDRAILLEKGRAVRDGAPSEVMDYYNALIAEKEGTVIAELNSDIGKKQTVSGTGEAKLADIALYNPDGARLTAVRIGEKVVLKARINIYADLDEMSFGYLMKDRLGQAVYGTNTWYTKQTMSVKKGDSFELSIAFEMNVGVGSYSVTTAITNGLSHVEHNCEWKELAYIFEVYNPGFPHFEGHSFVPSVIEIKKVI
jgi:lipopolysaccharide transport system ATP-binding protein